MDRYSDGVVELPRAPCASCMVAVFCIVGPWLGAGFLFGLPSLPYEPHKFVLLFAVVLPSFIFFYPVGIVPAFVAGCLSALVSRRVRSVFIFIVCSGPIGALSASGLALLLSSDSAHGTHGDIVWRAAASGAFAATCCAAICVRFRPRPM